MPSPKKPPPPAPPVEQRLPPAGRKFPCPACGARLDFDPSVRGLKCPYCGHQEVIAHAEAVERNWDEYWSHQTGDEKPIPGRSSQVTCGGCGAVVLLQDQVATDRCPYCATHLENQPQSAEGMVQPNGLLPFVVSERQAITAFEAWVKSRWFAPTGFRHFANLGKMSGLYAPFWTFDSMTYTSYVGERGDDYTETETYTTTESYTETDSAGNTVSRTRPVEKTRTITKTRWTSVSGQVDHFFDDVLIQASPSVPEPLVSGLAPWSLKQMEEFRAEFLSGFVTERYSVNLTDGFEKARTVMDGAVRQLCCSDIGGNHQRLHSVITQHVGVTFKHVLLPLWLAVYRYREQPYRVVVNGQTGKVSGKRPFSWIKITLCVLLVLALIATPILIYWWMNLR